MHRRRTFFVLSLVAFTIAIAYFPIQKLAAAERAPNAREAQAITEVLQRAYDLMEKALRNGGDVSEFDQVFADTKDFKLRDREAERLVEDVFGEEAAKKAGYLTWIKAKTFATGKAVKMLQDAQRLAEAEGRKVTRGELFSIQEKCYGVLPPSVIEVSGRPIEFAFMEIRIQRDRAIVRFDRGPALEEAVMIFRDGRWLIVSIVPINIHF